MAAAAAASARAIFCELAPQRPGSAAPIPRLRSADPSSEGGKIVLQPRLCTLRSYGSGARDLVVRTPRDADDTSPFFASLADYIESSRKSQDFEIVSGRFAMIAFAAAVSIEVVTGDSLFKKLELQQITEAVGVCVAVVACAATFAWFSRARHRIGQIFNLGCNTFVDSLIDNLVEALFYENDLSDWSDEI
ncbi:stress enhanced protein 2, chloroplastic [Typha angustifolia]|uniref:stress enhanced protein 2, chloroplastic n=1 Tax=Typha angustifolia TaxID=59011 RepID=UPI003C2EEFD0